MPEREARTILHVQVKSNLQKGWNIATNHVGVKTGRRTRVHFREQGTSRTLCGKLMLTIKWKDVSRNGFMEISEEVCPSCFRVMKTQGHIAL